MMRILSLRGAKRRGNLVWIASLLFAMTMSFGALANDIDVQLRESCIQHHNSKSDGLYSPEKVCECVVGKINAKSNIATWKPWIAENCPNGGGVFASGQQTAVCTLVSSYSGSCVRSEIVAGMKN